MIAGYVTGITPTQPSPIKGEGFAPDAEKPSPLMGEGWGGGDARRLDDCQP